MSRKAYYEALECSEESSYEEIKQNYRRLVLRYHPDKSRLPSGETADKFREIEEAWKILKDPSSRKTYDAECRQANLEAQSILVYETISAEDMDCCKDDDTMIYPCRCGSYYLVEIHELPEENCIFHVPCQECTFVLAVKT